MPETPFSRLKNATYNEVAKFDMDNQHPIRLFEKSYKTIFGLTIQINTSRSQVIVCSKLKFFLMDRLGTFK